MDDWNTLQSLVQAHKIHYEAWPHWEVNNGERVATGFDLELHATHDHGKTCFAPGSAESVHTYLDLKRIAEAVTPVDDPRSAAEIECFDQSLHAEGIGPLEVVLIMHVYHRNGYFSPIDDGEQNCLSAMESKLRSLGISGRRRRI